MWMLGTMKGSLKKAYEAPETCEPYLEMLRSEIEIDLTVHSEAVEIIYLVHSYVSYTTL